MHPPFAVSLFEESAPADENIRRHSPDVPAPELDVIVAGHAQASMKVLQADELRTYCLATTAEPRRQESPAKEITFAEVAGDPSIRTGNVMFDGLYAMALAEAHANSVSEISDPHYNDGSPIAIEAFQTGELWKYIWTRDLAYSLHLGLAGFDPARAVSSLLFKASALKEGVPGSGKRIVQDTGSGGSYPVSTDRVVWALGAHETLKHLTEPARRNFRREVYAILQNTIAEDRRLVFDPADGLYRGEQSFLDWREQTYPGWTRDNVLAIAMSKALSVNALNYLMLTYAADYAGQLGEAQAQARYVQWAGELHRAINLRFWDASAGLYSTYLLSDDGVSDGIRVPRYDLLGLALTILAGIADTQQSASILRHYPIGPFGPPVVWPQELSVPIYHNQGIWPFVTAYWIKAARQTGHWAAVDAGVQSLQAVAALNLSNLESVDFVTGQAAVTSGPRLGPTVNSRRQLWSVAGYLSMVQDIVFGFEAGDEGIRFQPFVTARLRNEVFRTVHTIEWRNLTFHGARHLVRVHLPALDSSSQGACTIDEIKLNGLRFHAHFATPGDLHSENRWDIFLGPPKSDESASRALRLVDTADENGFCAPLQPAWEEQRGIHPDGDRLVLTFEHADPANVTANIYRDGQLCAEAIRGNQWIDPRSGDYHDAVHSYRVASVDLSSGNVSHPTPALCYRTTGQTEILSVASIKNRGGTLVDDHHFASWGSPADTLLTEPVRMQRSGCYLVRAQFANGAGPVNTGIACAVKRLSVLKAHSMEPVATGYLVMPQSGDWKRFDLSSGLKADLAGDEEYVLQLLEDEYCRNMSDLENNQRYTASAGGGDASYNRVHLAAFHLQYLSETDFGAP